MLLFLRQQAGDRFRQREVFRRGCLQLSEYPEDYPFFVIAFQLNAIFQCLFQVFDSPSVLAFPQQC